MKIGIIGAGQIGGTLTRRLTALGHEVFVANSRGPATLSDLAAETGATAVSVHRSRSRRGPCRGHHPREEYREPTRWFVRRYAGPRGGGRYRQLLSASALPFLINCLADARSVSWHILRLAA